MCKPFFFCSAHTFSFSVHKKNLLTSDGERKKVSYNLKRIHLKWVSPSVDVYAVRFRALWWMGEACCHSFSNTAHRGGLSEQMFIHHQLSVCLFLSRRHDGEVFVSSVTLMTWMLNLRGSGDPAAHPWFWFKCLYLFFFYSGENVLLSPHLKLRGSIHHVRPVKFHIRASYLLRDQFAGLVAVSRLVAYCNQWNKLQKWH